MITTVADYKGEYHISTNKHTQEELEMFIDSKETFFLKRILGFEFAKLYLIDVQKEDVDREQRFKDLESEIITKNILGREIFCNGIKEMLIKLIYSTYTSDQAVKNTIAGSVKNNMENSSIVFNRAKICSVWNNGITDANVIRRFLLQEKETYLEFNFFSSNTLKKVSIV